MQIQVCRNFVKNRMFSRRLISVIQKYSIMEIKRDVTNFIV